MASYPEISVIVPVYNTEKYLQRCIDSILAQTFTDFEILLIDDGSTDGSGKICDEYAGKDSRVRVFHKINGGVASAREAGILNAKGKYSIHVDSDDWIEEDMLEEMSDHIKRQDLDILIADFYRDDLNGLTYVSQRMDSCDASEILKNIFRGRLFGSLWHKLVRHSLYRKYDIHFTAGIDYCEDVLVLARLLRHHIKADFLPKAYYHYNLLNDNSITRNYTARSYLMRKAYYFKLKEILPDSFASDLDTVALQVKKEALVNGVLSGQEYNRFFPMSFLAILKTENMGRKMKICFLLANAGFYSLSIKTAKWLDAR